MANHPQKAEMRLSATGTIGIDMGTSAMKGVLRSTDGHLWASASRRTEIERPQSGEVVFSSERSYEILCRLLRTLSKSAASLKITAIVLSGATGDTVLLGKDRKPRLPAIHWMDTRSSNDATIDPPDIFPADIYRISGWPWFRGFPMAHLAWLKQNQSTEYANADRIGMNITYQYHRLCGAWAMDYSTATTFYLQNQENKTWHTPYLDWLKLDPGKLPSLHPSGTPIGQITRQAAVETGLPEGCAVVLGAFDHPSAARGVGVTLPGELLLSLGTSWVGFYPVMDRSLAIRQNMLVDPFLSTDGGPWGAMFSLSKAGETLNEALSASYPATASAEERYRLFEQDLNNNNENAAVRLAEEFILTMRDKMDAFSRHGIVTERIVLVGGPSANSAIVALFRNLLQKSVQVSPHGGYAGAVGAALINAALVKSPSSVLPAQYS